MNEILKPNPALFSSSNGDRIVPKTIINLPENPNKPQPEPIPEPEPLPDPEPIIGKVKTQKGTTNIQRNGEIITVKQQVDLLVDDIIITRDASVADVQLIDETRFSMGSDSELNINTFSYLGIELPASEPEGSLIAFIQTGVIRTITGLLGKLNSNQYVITSTLTATIGIRGTDITVRTCTEELSCGSDLRHVTQIARAVAD